MNHANHHAQTQSRIASIIVQVVVEHLGGTHQLGQVEAKVRLYNDLRASFKAEGLLAEAESYSGNHSRVVSG